MQGPWFQLTTEHTVCLHFTGSSAPVLHCKTEAALQDSHKNATVA